MHSRLKLNRPRLRKTRLYLRARLWRQPADGYALLHMSQKVRDHPNTILATEDPVFLVEGLGTLHITLMIRLEPSGQGVSLLDTTATKADDRT